MARVNLQIHLTLAALAIITFETVIFQFLLKLLKKKKNKKLVYRKLITLPTIKKKPICFIHKVFLAQSLLPLQQYLPICNAFV